MIGERLLPWFNFLFVGGLAITAAITAILPSLFLCSDWRERMGRGSVGAITFHEKGSSAGSLGIGDRKFDSVTPTSRTPLGGGNTDRIRPRAS